MMNRPDNPCKKDCPLRSATCHPTCPAYKQYQKDLREYNAFINESRYREKLITSYKINSINKQKQKKEK